MRQEVTYELVGTTLELPITVKGKVLVNKGVVLTENLVSKLLRMGIHYIDVAIEEVALPKLEKPNTVSNELCDKVREALIANDVKQIEVVASDMITSVLNIADIDGGFSNLKYDLETFSNINTLDHSIRVAIFSIILAYLYNQKLRNKIEGSGALDEVNINDVAIAALMHDEGSNNYSPDVLNKISELKQIPNFSKQFPGVKDVPVDKFDDSYISLYSFCLIHGLLDLSPEAKFMVLMSSETENSNGPLKPIEFRDSKSNSAMGAKIIKLCSFYDNFLTHCYNTGESFENIISVLGQAASTETVNEELADLFLTNIPIYPVGAKIMLSNGEKAVVVKSYTGYTYSSRPEIRVLSTGEIIDLRYATTLTIERVCQEDESLEQVVDGQVHEVDKGRK